MNLSCITGLRYEFRVVTRKKYRVAAGIRTNDVRHDTVPVATL